MDTYIREAQRKIGVYLFLVALAARGVYLCQYANSPFFWVPSLDTLYHDLLARAIAAGRGDPNAFFRAPLYYYFLGGVYRLFGHSFWSARLVQALIGSASCVLLFLLGRRFFRPSVALLAAGMMALYGPLIFFDGELLTPVLEVFLDLCFLLLAARAIESRSRWEWLVAGLVLGLSAITRPNVLVVTPIALAWIWTRRTREQPRRAALTAAALFVAGAALAPALVTARNYRLTGDPVFIASQGGVNLFVGNRPEADGFTPSTPRRYHFAGPYEDSVGLYGRRAAEEALGRPLSASQAQTYWVRRVLQWWRHDPLSALKLTGKKCVLVWTHREIRNNLAYDFVRAEFARCLWFTFGFWFAGPFGLLGMALAWRQASVPEDRASERRRAPGDPSSLSRPRSASRFLVLFVLVYVASFVPFFVADRYRLPVVPPLLLFGAYACAWMGEQAQRREWKAFVWAGGALAALALFVNVDWYCTVTPATWALDYWSAGNGYQQMGHLREAEGEHRKALALDPSNPEIWTNLGVDQYGSGRDREASASFRRAIALLTPSGTAYFDLALCELDLHDPDRARRHLEQAVAVDPEYSLARVKLARLEGGRRFAGRP